MKTILLQPARMLFLAAFLVLFHVSCEEEEEPINSNIQDRIVLTNPTPFADLRVLVDGNFSSAEQSLTFVNDQLEFLLGGRSRLSGNYSPGDHNELILFQKGKAPTLVSDVNWTDGEDIIEVTMREMIEIPVTFWVMNPLPDEEVHNAVNSTNQHLDINRLGLKLVDVQIHDRTDIENVEHLRRWSGLPDQDMLNEIGFIFGRLNIYVTESLSLNGNPAIGIWSASPGIIAMNNTAFYQNQPWLFLHEIGHGLGLNHSERFGVPDNNVMFQGATRSVSARGFTAGQVFRAHLRPSGLVERLSETLSSRNCGETSSSLTCPDIATKIFF